MASIATMTGPEFDALPYEEGRRRQVVIYTAGQSVRKLPEGAILMTDLLPGFELQISNLFVI